MATHIDLIGQTLLNAELRNGLAAKDAQHHAHRMSEIRAGATVPPGELKKKVGSLEEENRKLEKAVLIKEGVANQARAGEAAAVAALAERDAIIAEWMHTNEAFKRLARQYGKKLGLPDDQRQEDLDNHILNIAEEDPRFTETETAKRAKGRLKVAGK